MCLVSLPPPLLLSQSLASVAGAVSSLCAVPAELTAGAQASAITSLSAVASAGAAVSGSAASATAEGLSSVALAAAESLTSSGRRRLLWLEPASEPAGRTQAEGSTWQTAALRTERGGSGRTLAATSPPSLAPSSDAPAGGGQSTLVAVFRVLDALSSSLQAGFTVPGESPSVLSAKALHMVSRLDSPGADSRLFSEPLEGPGSAFEPFPADLLDGVAGAGGAVRTQFLVTAFKCGGPLPSHTRLRATPSARHFPFE